MSLETRRTKRLSYLAPDLAATRLLNRGQSRAFPILLLIIVVAVLVASRQALLVLNALATALYVIAFLYGLYLVRQALSEPATVSVGDALARALVDSDLPVCTVLVPAYREPEVIGRLIRAMEALEYPLDRLDIKIQEPVDYRPGGFFTGRQLFVLDPSGNRIELRFGIPRLLDHRDARLGDRGRVSAGAIG